MGEEATEMGRGKERGWRDVVWGGQGGQTPVSNEFVAKAKLTGFVRAFLRR